MALVSHEKIHFPFSAAFPSRLRLVEPRCARHALGFPAMTRQNYKVLSKRRCKKQTEGGTHFRNEFGCACAPPFLAAYCPNFTN